MSYKKPSLEEFEDALRKTGGNLTQAAALLGVSRMTVTRWQKEDDDFKEAVANSRKRMFDKVLDVAYSTALGIPAIDPTTREFMGWKEKPDGQMLRYLLSTLGRDEGFAERQVIDLENPMPTVINVIKD